MVIQINFYIDTGYSRRESWKMKIEYERKKSKERMIKERRQRRIKKGKKEG